MALRTRPVLTIHWDPDPMDYAEALFSVANALEFTGLPLAAAASEVSLDIEERFATRTGPNGERWPDWSEKYAVTAEEYPNIGMLRQSDVMYQYVTSAKAMIVTNDTVFFDATEDLPPTTQKGSKAPTKGSEARIRYHQEGTNKMPARPFLGIDPESRAFIFKTFDEWFDGSLQLFTKKRGGLGTRHQLRGAGGQFIPRSASIPRRIR